jgi:hypothetical protein
MSNKCKKILKLNWHCCCLDAISAVAVGGGVSFSDGVWCWRLFIVVVEVLSVNN